MAEQPKLAEAAAAPAEPSPPEKPSRNFSGIKEGEAFVTEVGALAGIAPVPPEKPLGITVLIEDLHAVFVMARISMQPRPQPLNPSHKYRESFRRVRQALQQCGRLPT